MYVRAKQSTKIHFRLLYSADSLRRNSYVPPADLCSDDTLHSEGGEVAADPRRSVGQPRITPIVTLCFDCIFTKVARDEY